MYSEYSNKLQLDIFGGKKKIRCDGCKKIFIHRYGIPINFYNIPNQWIQITHPEKAKLCSVECLQKLLDNNETHKDKNFVEMVDFNEFLIIEPKPQKDFPYLKEFSEKFTVTPDTIFAYNGNIYSDNKLSNEEEIKQKVYLKRQKLIGADEWIRKYLTDCDFRLEEEIQAYKTFLYLERSSGIRDQKRSKYAEIFSGGLYNNLITFEEAKKRLR